MQWNLFLDDERYPATNNWIVVRSYEDAVWYVESFGLPDRISFDHDLGEGPTGYDFVKWLCDYIMDHNLNVSNLQWDVHSQNPVGAENIRSYLSNFLNNYTEN